MIKIDTSKIKNWDYIKKCHETYIEQLISKKQSEFIKNNYYVQYKSYKKIVDKYIKNVNLNKIIFYDFKEMKKICKEYESDYKELLNELNDRPCTKINEEPTESIINELKENFKNVFDYKGFCNNKNKISINNYTQKIIWNRHELITKMNISTCPYCNRQYITSYKDKQTSNIKTTADLDHFFPTSKYPFLAISLYNFIPSCQICNSRFKKDEFDLNILPIYPYEQSFEDNDKICKFTINSEDLDYLIKSNGNFKIELDNKNKNENIKKSIDLFKLNEVYQIHTDYVQELLKKSMIISDEMIDSILDQFPDMFKSKLEIYQTMMANYTTEDNLLKRPLSKLTKDICKEFGIEQTKTN